jgi:hypothetical protein
VDLVLGLSITSAAIRFVLVEGATGEGATVDKGTLALEADGALNDLVDAVLGDGPFAAVPGQRPRAIGVTWLGTATQQASMVLELLAAKGADNVISVSDTDAIAALATGIGDLSGSDDLAVCLVEPGSAVAALVDAHEVLVDVVDRPGPGDAADLARWFTALVDGAVTAPAVSYVLGSADDLDDVVAALDAAGLGVITAADADLALARGAALASAHSTYGLDSGLVAASPAPLDGAPAGRRLLPSRRVAAIASVLVAAVVTFVVSLSVAFGLRLTPTDSTVPEHAQAAKTSGQAPEAVRQAKLQQAPPPAVRVAPKPEAPPPPPPEAPPLEPVEAAPPVPEAPPLPDAAPPAAIAPEPNGLPAADPVVPAYVPPAAPVEAPPAYVPPAPAPAVEGTPPGFVPGNPAFVPPAPDGTVPPVQGAQPRLRDRIIERLPIINRFHGG